MSGLQHIARALGGEVNSGAISMPGPGHSKTDRSLRVFIDAAATDGFWIKTWAGDDRRQCRDHVKARLAGLTLECFERPRQVQNTPAAIDPRAIEIWSAAEPVRGSVAETYLARRGLSAAAGDDVLRYHPAGPFKLEDDTIAFLPTMLGLFRSIVTNEPCGIHRTALKADGSGKANHPGLGNPKKMLGRAKGAAIKLSADADVTIGLGIAEGIETGLTAFCANWRPIWAVGSAGAISTFPVLTGIEALTIFADADPTGLKAAKECQARWSQARRDCRIILPPNDGKDWNDIIGRSA